MIDFANILFSGPPAHPCNARCYFCIGQQIQARLPQANRDQYPLHGLETFLAIVQSQQVRQVVLTGVNTDPQLYRHEKRLLFHLRERLPPTTVFSLHTNGRLALVKMDIFNRYDKVSLSFPSFNPQTYQRMMRVPIIDLAKLLQSAQTPVKLSCLVTDDNRDEITEYVNHCASLGLRRVVLRKRIGEERSWRQLLGETLNDWQPAGEYRDNPIYQADGIEITLWDFATTTSASVNLFSSGEISQEYHLSAPHPPGVKAGAASGFHRFARQASRDMD